MVHSAGPGAMFHRPDSVLGIPKSPSFHSGLDLVTANHPAMYQGLPVQLPSLLGQSSPEGLYKYQLNYL